MDRKYFQITYDFDKLSDDEKKSILAIAQQNWKNGKAVSAGWKSIAKVENDGWISIDNPPPHSDRYLCQIKLKNEGVKTEIHYLCHNNNEYNKEVLGVTHWQYLPNEAESKNE